MLEADELARVLLWRNARLRAWAAVGLPVEGRWRHEGPGYVRFFFRCLACTQLLPFLRGFFLGHWGASSFESAEQDAAEHVLSRGCPHLSRLLGGDPPEVLEILPLELLAGDG
jgi:hypothetical protein